MTYLFKLPKREEIPAGKLLVHNHLKPTQRIGSTDFRIWLSPKTERAKVIACRCGWAPELGQHYRVKAIDVKAARKRR